MQLHIDISSYRDTLFSDTHLGHIDISNIDVSSSKCILLHTINAVVVHCGCELFSSATISCLYFEKITTNQ